MNPSVGRVVHFVKDGACFAAIVTHVWTPQCVNLYVFPDNSDLPYFKSSVMWNDVPSEYSWHWPERVE